MRIASTMRRYFRFNQIVDGSLINKYCVSLSIRLNPNVLMQVFYS